MTVRRTLADWLAWQEGLHPKAVDLGLERVARVAEAMGLVPPPYRVLTVAGTNGKGSSVAYAEALLRTAGLRVGAYTSPHLLRYNERVRIDGREAADPELVAAFEAVDAARGRVPLTYFEFGTLAALHRFGECAVDVAVLEVGLGGRLDAVNAVDADVALITSIGLDHMEWLGPDRESIGREKAGILRPGRPAVLTDPAPPASVLNRARQLRVPLRRVGVDFHVRETGRGRWRLAWSQGIRWNLPGPGIPGRPQWLNAAGAIEAVRALGVALDRDQVANVLPRVRLPGRFQRLAGAPELVLDVAHNEDACAALADSLHAAPPRRPTVALLGVLADKRPQAMARRLAERIDSWVVTTPPGARALEADKTAEALTSAGLSGPVHCVPAVAEALAAARARAGPTGRVVVFGSFRTVEAVCRLVGRGDQ